jgi:WD40 repeat protein
VVYHRRIGGREAACPHGRHRLLCPRGKLDQPTIIHALPGLINAAAFSQDGREVVYGGSARKTDAGEYWKKWGQSLGYIAGWFWREAKPAFESAKTRTEPIDAAFHPENRTLAVACAGGEVIFLSRLNGSVMKVEKSKTTDPTTFLNQPKRWIRFSSSGRFLITGSRDWTIRLWDLNSSQLVRTFENQDEVIDARFFGNGRWIIAAIRDGSGGKGIVRVWNVHSPLKVMPDVPLDGFFPFTLELTPDESAALIDGFLASIQIVDLRRFNLEVLSKFDSSEM